MKIKEIQEAITASKENNSSVQINKDVISLKNKLITLETKIEDIESDIKTIKRYLNYESRLRKKQPETQTIEIKKPSNENKPGQKTISA